MQKIVLKVEFYCDKKRQKAMKIASGISGVESIGVEAEQKKMTIVGEIDAVKVVGKLRKVCRTEIVSVGSADKEEKEDPPEAVVEAPYDDIVHGYYSFHNYYPPPPYHYCYYYHR